MKKIIIMMIVTALTLVGCVTKEDKRPGQNKDGSYTGVESIETRAYDLKDFKHFNISNDFDTTIEKGDAFKVEVTTNKDVFDKLDISSSSNTLTAKNIKDVWFRETQISLTITCPEVVNFNLDNDAKVMLIGAFSTNEDVSISSQSDTSLTGELSSANLSVRSTSDSRITLSGTTNEIIVTAESDSKINLKDLIGTNASVTLSSDAKCDINVSGEITLNSESSPTLNVHSGKVNKQTVSEDTIINE
ncbi:hypothetical protein EZV73_02740 [Acidaminobacter sp. JC074]|uniref:GIN domain-containing protein n=1 Tax=Acidaminobacter sp. JC074 TaxID=2530199 RepID=UPI001F118200|nr:DUF2807 domain-containing protein [Acidaminobacter sp. JC074]MCH4886464.1 hypothetical protein [Acidaminobacter sp. JC074]